MMPMPVKVVWTWDCGPWHCASTMVQLYTMCIGRIQVSDGNKSTWVGVDPVFTKGLTSKSFLQ